MGAERDKREPRKNVYFEWYSPPIFGILIHGKVDKIFLVTTLSSPNYRLIMSQNNFMLLSHDIVVCNIYNGAVFFL